MKNAKVTFNQVMFSIVLFNFGSSVVMGVSTSVGQEAWIPILMATLAAIPMFLIYGSKSIWSFLFSVPIIVCFSFTKEVFMNTP